MKKKKKRFFYLQALKNEKFYSSAIFYQNAYRLNFRKAINTAY